MEELVEEDERIGSADFYIGYSMFGVSTHSLVLIIGSLHAFGK
jgi:hypothetical protein